MAQIDGRIHPSVARLWHRYYPHYDPDQFAALVASHVDPSSQVLEIGAGSGRGQQRRFALKGKVARYVGIDLDERVLDNPHLDEAVVGDAQHLPFEDGTFDVVFHTMVAEHLQKPLAAVAEMARVLRSGGRLIFQTPNRFYYPMLLSALTPHWFHAFYARKLGGGREASEVFATVYRLNDRRAIMSATEQAGLRADVQFWSTPPGYLRFSRPSFLLGVLYERTVERLVPALRATIVMVATKP